MVAPGSGDDAVTTWCSVRRAPAVLLVVTPTLDPGPPGVSGVRGAPRGRVPGDHSGPRVRDRPTPPGRLEPWQSAGRVARRSAGWRPCGGSASPSTGNPTRCAGICGRCSRTRPCRRGRRYSPTRRPRPRGRPVSSCGSRTSRRARMLTGTGVTDSLSLRRPRRPGGMLGGSSPRTLRGRRSSSGKLAGGRGRHTHPARLY